MSSGPRLVWYLLFDSADGQPCKGTSADKVSVGPDADVADFRKKVYKENSSILTGITSSQLVVYKNKDAFDKRNAADNTKKVPLKSSSSVNAVGESEEDALIVVVPWISSSEGNVHEPSAKRRSAAHFEQTHFVEVLKEQIPAPSSFARYNEKRGWVNFLKNNPNKLICHRDCSEEPSVPVCLLNPIFNSFVHDLNHIHISSKDCQFVAELTERMCGAFINERERRDTFIDLFEEYTQMRLGPVTRNNSTTDGSLTFTNGALYCNLEVNVEKCGGNGDPYMQSIAYYILNLPTSSNNIQYPCFLLELCGTAFSVSGILNTDKHVICDPLSPTFQLYHNQEIGMLQQITKLFAALVKSLMSLGQPLQKENQNILQSLSSFPFLSSFCDMDTKEEFMIQYQQKIKCLLFSARRLDSDKEVIVKFCSRYNNEVHLYCHDCGFAPRLISCSAQGNYIVVVMEKLNLSRLTDDHLSTSEIIQQIDTISSRLEERHFVHGDLRDCNVHFDTENNKVVVVDFDWAGRNGVDLYPPFMNPKIEWPDGASTGEKMYHVHDVYWLNRLLRRESHSIDPK